MSGDPIRERLRILIGTTNPSKIAFFQKMLEGLHAAIVTPCELEITGEPQETGTTPEENARIKAAYYGRYADYALCADSGLFFDELPMDDPRQPGLHIRTPHGVRLNDDEMIEHYSALSRALGGRALAYYLDGRVSAVFGTHTHVQTADEQILPGGTGFLSDVGMVGPVRSILGVKPELIIQKMKGKLPVRFENGEGDCRMDCVLFTIDEKTGKTTAIERMQIG